MTELEKKVLTRLQRGVPIVEKPFEEMARDVSINENRFTSMTHKLLAEGLIRDILPVFESEKMSYESTLVACEVEAGKLDEVAEFINEHPGVTHNYERSHRFNLWFTVTLPREINLSRTLGVFKGRDGILKMLSLPRTRTYKIRVVFDLDGSSLGKVALKRVAKNSLPEIEREKFVKIVRSLQKTLPLVNKPFEVLASDAGVDKNEYLRIVKELYEYGVIRRFPAMVRHRDVGFSYNALVVWRVSQEKLDEVGEEFAKLDFVTHCYARKVYREWNYNLYAMTHSRSSDESSKNLERMVNISKVSEHVVLESLKEYKKIGVKYFDPKLEEWNRKYLVTSDE